ncbi:LysM peptidoglycan-binding domain-containing protein [Cytobacillus depressus]|uniref:LysM peptidoglycan-binding domain-containing protein n=1 Tax=Cytobacillus depressus TaxID=1602942 RepID=A0A6L3V419_9BACI|nr:cell wall hydrolase [Cytobacillus depressus]KAB2334821.1 LysM peptidoglycan-binding domain-containing protein [Cytobacillus depressus]
MRKLKKLLIAGTLSITLFGFAAESNAAASTHLVHNGETFWTIANQYRTTVLSLKKANNRTSDLLYAGEKIVIPNPISAADRELIAKLVRAEAVGEPYAGKVAVATVVLNRLDSPLFPNTVSGVIYEKVSGHYAFTPVQNGTINQAPDQESRRAVEEALAFRGKGKGSLYFFNPKTSTSKWIFSREVTVTIGKHRFAK